MTPRNKLAQSGLLLLVVTAALTGCTRGGDVTITNESTNSVNVTVGDNEFTVAAGGVAVVLGTGCISDEVRVDFESGATEAIAGDICPDQQVFIPAGDTETVDLRPAPQG
jgi:hypothetical protein